MNDFNKEFKRTQRTINLIYILSIVFVVIGIFGLVTTGIKVKQGIKKDGLKGVIERIWVGESEKD